LKPFGIPMTISSSTRPKLSAKIGLVLTYAHLIYVHTQQMTRAARFVLRTLALWKPTMQWLLYIEKHSFLRNAPDFVRRVLSDKIHRPYAFCNQTAPQRVDLLVTHYDLMKGLFAPETILSFVSGQRQELAQIKGQHEAEDYAITISREMLSQHQGELALLMVDPKQGIYLTRLVINLAKDEHGDLQLVVNGIQGPGPEYKNRIVRVTRNLDGLRPKRAIMEVACAIARALGAKSILAVGKKNHVSQTKKKWQLRNRTDYDSFWQEFNADPMASGDYLLPLTLTRRDPEEIIGKKRKAAVSRYALLDKLAADVEATVGGMRVKN